MLHVDIPTPEDFDRLATVRADACVSIYVPTSPVTHDAEVARLETKNLARQAMAQLEESGLDKRRCALLEELVDELLNDAGFWAYLSHSLAILLTPDDIRTFRLPNRLASAVEVADRFYLKPLLRALTFPHTAHVLALAANSVRLIEVTSDSPAFEVRVSDLPTDARAGIDDSDRSAKGRVQGGEGEKVRLRQYARAVDRALRPLLSGTDVPLVLAAAEPLASIYRSVNSYPHLADEMLAGNPEELSETQLAERVREVLDGIYRDRIADVNEVAEQRVSSGLVARDLGDIARAATYGAVDTLLIDIDEHVPGLIDERTGEVALTGDAGPGHYGVVDEIARRALRSGSRVYAVRADDIGGDGPALAILRYAV